MFAFDEHIRKLSVKFLCLLQLGLCQAAAISPLQRWDTLHVFLLTINVPVEVSGISLNITNQYHWLWPISDSSATDLQLIGDDRRLIGLLSAGDWSFQFSMVLSVCQLIVEGLQCQLKWIAVLIAERSQTSLRPVFVQLQLAAYDGHQLVADWSLITLKSRSHCHDFKADCALSYEWKSTRSFMPTKILPDLATLPEAYVRNSQRFTTTI